MFEKTISYVKSGLIKGFHRLIQPISCQNLFVNQPIITCYIFHPYSTNLTVNAANPIKVAVTYNYFDFTIRLINAGMPRKISLDLN